MVSEPMLTCCVRSPYNVNDKSTGCIRINKHLNPRLSLAQYLNHGEPHHPQPRQLPTNEPHHGHPPHHPSRPRHCHHITSGRTPLPPTTQKGTKSTGPTRLRRETHLNILHALQPPPRERAPIPINPHLPRKRAASRQHLGTLNPQLPPRNPHHLPRRSRRSGKAAIRPRRRRARRRQRPRPGTSRRRKATLLLPNRRRAVPIHRSGEDRRPGRKTLSARLEISLSCSLS